MAISRPLSKNLLKKMFMKVLYLHRPGGPAEHSSPDLNGIIRSGISEHYKIYRLSEEEMSEAYRGVFELERDGYLMQNHTQSSQSFKVLTKRGLALIDREIEEMKLSSIDIDQIIQNANLIRSIHDDFIEGDYETAIFKSFRQLEESVRNKSCLGAEVIGAELMSRAFRPQNGILKYKFAQTEAEEEALHLLMRSTLMMFKNPSSHRTVGYDNENEAIEVIGVADLLLSILDKCILR